MAAYAALISVMQIIDQIQLHPHPPISLHKQQISSLTQIITFLQDFLESYNPHLTYSTEADPLESRIAEAAYAAEDVIESYIVDQILARSTNNGEKISCFEFYQCLQTKISYIVDSFLNFFARCTNHGEEFYQGPFELGLQKVIEEMDLIKMEVVEMKQNKGLQHQQLYITNSVTRAGSFRSTSTAQEVSMVGFDDVLYQMLEQITRGRPHLQIIPIVGMGGIGKTTLARNIYVNSLVEHHFDVRAWSAISQLYKARKILREILDQVDEGNMGNLSEDELGEQLYKCLIGRRYFIVMDDMWSIEAWDGVRRFFPDNENGSRIVVTTRLSNLASLFNCSNSLEMKFLDEVSSWNLFSKTVLGDEICPLELEGVGKMIVKGCKGLPLSIIVIGGLLSKIGQTLENWEFIEENLNSIVNLNDNESCLQILYMSYNNLSVYLKPCFLYMGLFEEDYEIPVDSLITLWVAEGILKPFPGKSLEEVAEEYLEELVDRNLILVEKRNHYGKLESCKIHDLLRDLSLREAQKVKFLCVLREQSIYDIPQGIDSQRRIRSTLPEYPPTLLFQSVESASLVRSLIGKFPKTLSYNFRLLRVSLLNSSYFEEKSRDSYEEIFQLVNLRLLSFGDANYRLSRIPSSISHLWNLQTLILLYVDYDCIFEIWKMPQLRHVMAYMGSLCLPDPPLSRGTDVLENLQSLFVVRNLILGEGVFKRIPNIKKLKLYYDEISTRGGDYCLNNLSSLHKLESLRLCSSFMSHRIIPSFPYSLKKLTLENTKLDSQHMKRKIGLLPLLQVLKLREDSFIGSVWETFEGQFSSLKFLMIHSCDLEYWKTDNTHFPRLVHLVLCDLSLREIPSSIGDIPTLQSIKMKHCSDSAVDSARRILEEQNDLGNEGLQLKVEQ